MAVERASQALSRGEIKTGYFKKKNEREKEIERTVPGSWKLLLEFKKQN